MFFKLKDPTGKDSTKICDSIQESLTSIAIRYVIFCNSCFSENMSKNLFFRILTFYMLVKIFTYRATHHIVIHRLRNTKILPYHSTRPEFDLQDRSFGIISHTARQRRFNILPFHLSEKIVENLIILSHHLIILKI